MKKLNTKPFALLLSSMLLCSASAFSSVACESTDPISMQSKDRQSDGYTAYVSISDETSSPTVDTVYDEEAVNAQSDNIKVGSRLLDLLFGDSKDKRRLIPGGNVLGIKIDQEHVSVVESKGIPALSAGDVILSVNGKEVKSAEDVKSIVQKSGGDSVTVKARHKGNTVTIEVRPRLEDGEYMIGLTLRDGAMGIGTLTFIDPETGAFGGLGHGITDSESGEIIEMDSGTVTGVILGGIHKGECGKPGELTGILTDENLGTLTRNNDCGVFGKLSANALNVGESIPIATRDEVHEGEAVIISTVKNGKPMPYTVRISEVDRQNNGSKCFRIEVTDKTLIAISGGIVRGMSGSPIIQDGKLVGAVTHVMVADPTEGYGIFIENMLNASQAARNELPAA